MYAGFRFFDHDALPGPRGWEGGGRPGFRFRCTEGHAIDRGNYGGHSLSAVDFDLKRFPRRADAEVLDCRLIRRGRGATPPSPDNLFFITTCRIGDQDAMRFLDQFDTASRYMVSRPGIVRFRLYRSLSPAARFQFVNLAQWRSAKEFMDAFARDEFKALLKGGFDHTSQIIVAKLWHQ